MANATIYLHENDVEPKASVLRIASTGERFINVVISGSLSLCCAGYDGVAVQSARELSKTLAYAADHLEGLLTIERMTPKPAVVDETV